MRVCEGGRFVSKSGLKSMKKGSPGRPGSGQARRRMRGESRSRKRSIEAELFGGLLVCFFVCFFVFFPGWDFS